MSDILILFAPPEAACPDQTAINWFLKRGIDIMSIASPWPVWVARVTFEPSGRYTPCTVGDFAYVFAVIDDGIIDAVAWAPANGRIGTRLGIGALIGEGQVGRDGIGTTGPPLPVWRSPIGWLKARRVGVVVVDPELAAHRLAGLTLQAEDHHHRAELKQRLQLPKPTIVLPTSAERIAA